MTPRRKRIAILSVVGALLIAMLIAGAIYERRPQFFPYVVMQSGETLQVRFLLHARAARGACESQVQRVAQTLLAQCPTCGIPEAHCLEKLDPVQRKVLYGHPVDVPTMRMPEGVLVFFAASPDLALQTCMESATQAKRIVPGRRDCAAAGVESLQLTVSSAQGAAPPGRVPGAWPLAAVTAFAALVSFALCFLIVRFPRWHAWFSQDQVEGGPQKFHATPTPRIGGLALAAALGAGIFLLDAMRWLQVTSVEGLTLLALAAIPPFAGGLAEDVTKRVGVLARLTLTISGGVIAALLIGVTLDHVGVPGLDTALLRWPFFAIAFTAIAVGGIANGINIIDGYNGLVAGYAILVLGAIAWVAAQVGDPVILAASLLMAGGVLGFLVWNYPSGRVFLGDGGAYLMGFWLAELSVLLVVRNPAVSPWFPMVLLAYPVIETFFSIYRKKILRGGSPSQPDGLHFHMLIYKRLARVGVGSSDAGQITYRNSLVGRYIWAWSAIVIAPTLVYWNSTGPLLVVGLLVCFSYLWLYYRLVRWRAPTWLIASVAMRRT